MTLLETITALASLWGVVLNIKHDRRCFCIWGVTNATWAAIDFSYGIYPQACLQAVYCGLSVWGLWEWRKTAK